MYVAPAVIDGRVYLRPCLVNYRTSDADVRALVDVAREVGAALAGADRLRSAETPGRSAEPLRHDQVGFLGSDRVSGDRRQELVAVEREQLHIGRGGDRGGARRVSQQRDLAEESSVGDRGPMLAFDSDRGLAGDE